MRVSVCDSLRASACAPACAYVLERLRSWALVCGGSWASVCAVGLHTCLSLLGWVGSLSACARFNARRHKVTVKHKIMHGIKVKTKTKVGVAPK